MHAPLFLLGSRPTMPAQFRDLFSAGPGSIIEMLKNPPHPRELGWDLRTLDDPRVVKGEYVEVGRPDYKLIQAHRDGSFLLRGTAGENLLSWASSRSKFPGLRINPVVVAELTYHFVQFSSQLLPHFVEQPSQIQLSIGLRHAHLSEEERLYVLPYEVDTSGWKWAHEVNVAPEDEMNRDVVVNTTELISHCDEAAYKLVAEFYAWFGVTSNAIPYSVTVDGRRAIDLAKIMAIG